MRPAWKAGWASSAEQREPAPLQALSAQPRVVDARLSDVPPTAVTYGDEAGYWTP